MKLKKKLIKNKTFKNVLIVSSIFLIVSLAYGSILLKYDLTLINTYDYNHDKNPCYSENDYKGVSRFFVCMIYYEEKLIDKLRVIKK